MQALDRDRIRKFYDRFGAKQDKQGFYEDAPLDVLVRQGRFQEAKSVLEVGCGTGRLAERLLSEQLPDTSRYLGIDISDTMVALARQRLAPWDARARVLQSSGDFDFSSLGGPFDRVVFTYVFDLLSESQIKDALAGAHTALLAGGLLCSAGLTHGTGPLSRVTSTIWTWVHRANPYLVGGCRPLRMTDHLPKDRWRVQFSETVVSATVPSEVVIAEKR